MQRAPVKAGLWIVGLVGACSARSALPPEAAYVAKCQGSGCAFTVDSAVLRSTRPLAVLTARCTDDAQQSCQQERIGLVTSEGRRRLLEATAMLESATLPERVGCPGCADGPIDQIQVTHADGQQTRHAYESGRTDLPEALAPADRLLNNMRRSVRACESSVLVDVLEPCSP